MNRAFKGTSVHNHLSHLKSSYKLKKKRKKKKPNNNKLKKTKNNFYVPSVVAHIFKSQYSGRQVSEFKSSLTCIVNSRLARDTK